MNEIKARYSRKGDVIEQQHISHKFVGPLRQIAGVAPQCQLYKLSMTNLSFHTCATGKISSSWRYRRRDSTFPGVGIQYRCVLGPAWSFETSFPGGTRARTSRSIFGRSRTRGMPLGFVVRFVAYDVLPATARKSRLCRRRMSLGIAGEWPGWWDRMIHIFYISP